MRVAVELPPTSHSTPFLSALMKGIAAAGDTVFYGRPGITQDFDVAVCWGWRRAKRWRKLSPSKSVLVMERGYVGDRFHWCSLGWNGLNGRAVFPKPPIGFLDPLDRWLTAIAPSEPLMQPWKPLTYKGVHIAWDEQYALILGQVQNDQACIGVNLPYQYRMWKRLLEQRGHTVKFRPHPHALGQGTGVPWGSYTRGTLAEDLAGAKFTVSWNSNASVDSVLAGVPSVTFDEGAMAWPVTSHDLTNPVTMPCRTEWAAQLAWCQWQPSELVDGTAWRAVREVKP